MSVPPCSGASMPLQTHLLPLFWRNLVFTHPYTFYSLTCFPCLPSFFHLYLPSRIQTLPSSALPPPFLLTYLEMTSASSEHLQFFIYISTWKYSSIRVICVYILRALLDSEFHSILYPQFLAWDSHIYWMKDKWRQNGIMDLEVNHRKPYEILGEERGIWYFLKKCLLGWSVFWHESVKKI